MVDARIPLASMADPVPPPAEAVDGRGDWAVVEREPGIQLPYDYKQLVATCGRGGFWDALFLRTPFGEDNPDRLAADLLEDSVRCATASRSATRTPCSRRRAGCSPGQRPAPERTSAG
ncbi:hypothetical protein P8605_17180 [Streptomyces sp. T-3]|nr:hypothetical protein [Streptomyces sp. T-3]